MVRFCLFFAVCLLLSGCGQGSLDIPTIPDFNLEKYMGKWYEVARIDNRFQRNMIDVTANYTLKKNGVVEVFNRGYNTKKERWGDAKARGTTTKIPNLLKVSFFPLTSGNYWVVYVDDNYSVAVVSGGDPEYLWILSREPNISEELLNNLIEKGVAVGHKRDDIMITQKY